MRSTFTKFMLSAVAVLGAASASAQSSRSDPAWEFSLGALYQNAALITTEGGSAINTDPDWGFNMGFGYDFNPYLDLLFGFDFQTVGYDAELVNVLGGGRTTRVSGDYEQFTPFVKLNMNLLPINFTPFVSGGIGYTFIDTNIPTSRVEVGCWWDPWYGYICTPYQSTKSEDDWVYQLGAGLRFDFRNFSMRAEYQKRWTDVGKAQGSPGLDQAMLSIVFRY